MRDSIFISVYDEREIDTSDESAGRGGGGGGGGAADANVTRQVSKRIDRHLLGTLEVPFTTVYLNGVPRARARAHASSAPLAEFWCATTRETLSNAEMVNGRLRLTVPPMLIGYKISAGTSVESAGEQNEVRGAEDSVSAAARLARGSYIELFITLHPLLAVPEQPTLHVRFSALLLPSSSSSPLALALT